MSAAELIASFVRYLQYEKRFSEHTVSSYQSDIEQFVQYLEEECLISLNEVRLSHFRNWVVWLLSKDISNKSIQRKRASVNKFFKFLLKNGHVESNPISKSQVPKTEKKLPVYLRESEVERFLTQERELKTVADWRDYAIFLLFYATGIRKSELIALKHDDIMIEGTASRIKVMGKGNKERMVPLSEPIVKILEKYFEKKQLIVNQKESPYIFLTDKGEQLYPKFVYNCIKKQIALISTIQQKSPHILRHSFATHLANNGTDLEAIKELLGHKNLNATQIYTHTNIEKIKELYRNSHPKGK